MFIKLRKQLNQYQGGGNTLDSPDANNQNIATATTVEPAPVIPPVVEPIVEPIIEPVIVVDPNNPEPTLEPVEKQWYEEAAAHVGIEIDEPIEDSIEGIAKFATKVGERFAQDAVEKEYQELEVKAPAGLELTKWQLANPNRDVNEFYASKLGTPSIDPESLDVNDTEKHRDILYKDFMRRGLSEKMASTMAQNSVDSNSSHEDAKEVLALNVKENEQERARKEEEHQRESKAKYEAFVKDVKAREQSILTTGRLGNIIIPEIERKAFANDNYYDAGNPQYPGMSAIDIKMATMTPEERDTIRLFLWKNLKVDGLVIAKDTTRTVSGILNRGNGGTGSRMNESTPRIGGGSNADRKLDSPGQ